MKILIAPNSFKECALSNYISSYLADSIKERISSKNINSPQIIEKPVSDGGDGFLDICSNHFNLEMINFPVSTPFSEDTLHAPVGIDRSGKTVYIESAKVLGLDLIPKEYRNPKLLSSKGLGELIFHLNQYLFREGIGVKKVVIGVGGTGTNDLGLGAASIFGLSLSNDRHFLPVIPDSYIKASKITSPVIELPYEIEVVVDVVNPLLGPFGASYQFAKQKGASDDDIDLMEQGFSNVLNLLNMRDVDLLSGAGGGLAAGLKLFFNAKITKAELFITGELDINSYHIKPDVVITGEGKFDAQTELNKGAKIVINEFNDGHRKIFVICGTVEDKTGYSDKIEFIELMDYFDTIEDSIKNIDVGLEKAVEKILMKINL